GIAVGHTRRDRGRNRDRSPRDASRAPRAAHRARGSAAARFRPAQTRRWFGHRRSEHAARCARRRRNGRGSMKLVLVLVALSAGCAVHPPETNAPGNADVLEPPHDLGARKAERPKDPGEDMVVLTYGALAGGGVAFPKDENAKGAYGVGPEVSVH